MKLKSDFVLMRVQDIIKGRATLEQISSSIRADVAEALAEYTGVETAPAKKVDTVDDSANDVKKEVVTDESGAE